jgi:hypothetical protein
MFKFFGHEKVFIPGETSLFSIVIFMFFLLLIQLLAGTSWNFNMELQAGWNSQYTQCEIRKFLASTQNA